MGLKSGEREQAHELVTNATRRREHCALADDDAAWVRERYAADAELWDRVNVGGGGFRAVF